MGTDDAGQRVARWSIRILAGAAGIVVAGACGPRAAERVVLNDLIRCELRIPERVTVGDPVPLSLRLSNPQSVPADFLIWGTPFEEMWTGPVVLVERDGVPLEYLGPIVKRGTPTAVEYRRIPVGGHVEAELPLHEVFDLATPGRYRLTPRFVLADVVWDADDLPRSLAEMREEPLRCAEGLLEVVPRR